MAYRILKTTLCHVDNHVWIWAGQPDMMPDEWRCDCSEFTWKAQRESLLTQRAADDGESEAIQSAAMHDFIEFEKKD